MLEFIKEYTHMTPIVFVIAVAVIVLIILGIYQLVTYLYNKKGWRCVEGGCREVLGGEYDSFVSCKTACENNQKQQDEIDKRIESFKNVPENTSPVETVLPPSINVSVDKPFLSEDERRVSFANHSQIVNGVQSRD